MRKVLVVADERGWAFDGIYNGLNDNCQESLVEVLYLNDHNPIQHDINTFDVVLYLCDNYPLPLVEWVNRGLPKERVILAVRSNVDHILYDKPEILEHVCGTLAVSNDKLFDRFKGLHSNVKKAPGGVDTNVFTYKHRKTPDVPVVGWSGSVGVFDREFRGLDITQQACDELGWIFKPALREVKHRNQAEMVEYYHNDIDIYVEMSKSAGRQNGMLEAASTGMAVVSYNCGIAEEFLARNLNGRIVQERTVEALKKELLRLHKEYEFYAGFGRACVDNFWSWEVQYKYFESLFKEICK